MPYSTADVRLAWQAHHSIQLSVVAVSLKKKSHYEFGGDPGPLVGIRRTVYGQIAWQR